MDLNSFFDALEELAARLIRSKDPFENISELLQLIMDTIQPNREWLILIIGIKLKKL